MFVHIYFHVSSIKVLNRFVTNSLLKVYNKSCHTHLNLGEISPVGNFFFT
jgi:hypothetical protein